MPEHLPIFVYGTLKRGEVRARCWPRSAAHVVPATTQGWLYDLGPYPALIDGTDTVVGELWFVNESDLVETLRVLDEIECFGVDDVDLYVRVTITCASLAGETFRAYTYHFAHPQDLDSATRVAPDDDGLCRWPRHNQTKAVILLSGGLDSATVMAIARQDGYELNAISFRYGQRHAIELNAAQRVARAMSARRHVIVDIDLQQFGGSALTADIPVPKHETAAEIGPEIPMTYVPARNTVFLSLALAWAETLNCRDIFLGVNALDYSGYPDCRPEFVAAFERLANLATKAGVEGGRPFKIHAPLIQLTKAEIIRLGVRLGVDYGLTTSCYDPQAAGIACGRCDSCLLRSRGFFEVGIDDPACAREVP